MKKIISILIAICVTSISFNITLAKEKNEKQKYIELLSEMINEHDSGEYFTTLTVTIGESNLVKDNEIIPIDDSGSTAYVENGRTMMPVRGIAEVIGAEVSYDDLSQTVKVKNEQTTIAMTIGMDEMEVNGQKVALLSAPKLRENRTMLPVRDVAEALDCEVDWDEETQTAIFTRDYQTKRVIVDSENAVTTNSVAHFSADGKTVIQFNNIEDAKRCVETNSKKGYKAEPDYVRKVSAMSWGIDEIGSQTYYNEVDYATGSAIVAVVDTGIDLSHSYFKGRLVTGYDLGDNDSNPQDSDGHGTHVSSTVLDVAGFNPSIKIMPVKVFEDGEEYTYSSTIAAGIEYAVDNGADVINLSVGGEGYSSAEQKAINYAYSRNVAVVAAAGNESLNLDNNNYSPGALDHVITVSAMKENGSIADFSNYGSTKVEFTAPGVSIKGAKLGGGYCKMSGTSMASPHVAGVYAIVKSVHPNESVDDITDALRKNVTEKNNPSYFGYGLINVDGLERYLSYINCTNENISSITETTAVVSGKFEYDGIKPEAVGVTLKSKWGEYEACRINYSSNDGNKMNFSYKLEGLKSGTTYEAILYGSAGGFRWDADTVTFTTLGTPPPEPPKSELRILPEKVPSGTLTKGKQFALSGRIKSDYHITDVRGYILDANKNVVMESSGWTTTQTYVIENSSIDAGLKFGNLPSGTYYLKYYAADESGNSVSWISDAFSVAESKAVSELRILPEKVPSGTLSKGKSFGLSGRIKSNYHITDVRAYILDANKNVVMEASGWTTTQTYVIENSALDEGMKFGNLSSGTYYLKYYAADESGNSVTWISDAFSIAESAKSELRILPEKVPSGTLSKGKSFGLSGRIKSNCHITDVRAYILDANKNVVMEASGWTTTQTYVIENSALDKGMKFGNLSSGTYYLKYYAADESGNSVSWISDAFYIK